MHEVGTSPASCSCARRPSLLPAAGGCEPDVPAVITKAVAEALKQHPKLNASFSEDNKEITYHASEDIAIAVDTEKGLLVPS
ncbi:hypothetical protein GS466_05165 [Rhodococcus hoagii]|nr:hypothetical protein [Prescottella equi]